MGKELAFARSANRHSRWRTGVASSATSATRCA